MKTQTFYRNKYMGDKIIREPVKGYSITLEGFEDITFFIAKTGHPFWLYKWAVYETKTGCHISTFGQTKKKAIESTLLNLKNCGMTPEKVKESINTFISQWGTHE